MPHPLAKVHRMFELVEPIATVTFSEVPNEAFLALGMRNYFLGTNGRRPGTCQQHQRTHTTDPPTLLAG